MGRALPYIMGVGMPAFLLLAVPAQGSSLDLLTDTNQPYGVRYAAIRELPGPLSTEDWRRLTVLLSLPLREMGQQEEARFFNDLLNNLVERPGAAQELFPVLRRVALDHGRDSVVRDYAVQFLANLYGKSRDVKAIRDTLLQVLGEDATLPGTSLRALTRLAMTDPAIDRGELEKACGRFLKDTASPPSVLSVALQCAPDLGGKRWLPEIRREIRSSHPGVAASALRSLGELGDEGDLMRLREIEAQGGVCSRAAHLAQARLHQRIDLKSASEGVVQ